MIELIEQAITYVLGLDAAGILVLLGIILLGTMILHYLAPFLIGLAMLLFAGFLFCLGGIATLLEWCFSRMANPGLRSVRRNLGRNRGSWWD